MAGFDPRRHSSVALSIKEKQPLYYSSRSQDQPLKSYMIGPSKPDPAGVNSLRRPGTSPAGPHSTNLPKTKNGDAHPPFLSPDGKWLQAQLPTLIAETQAQPLCSTGTSTSLMPRPYGAERPVRPLTSVVTYNDISPVSSAQHVYDGDASDPVATIRRKPDATTPHAAAVAAKMDTASFTERATIGDPQARIKSINTFWNRQNGAYNLEIKDVERIEELGKNVVPGTPNCRLIGSRWRFIPRPVEGDVIYTDFYGRCGEDPCNYYGRRYETNTSQFQQNRLVDDSDYVKVQASMTGIHSLRTRPGLSLDATVVSGPSAKLEKLSPYMVKEARGVHKLAAYARLKASA